MDFYTEQKEFQPVSVGNRDVEFLHFFNTSLVRNCGKCGGQVGAQPELWRQWEHSRQDQRDGMWRMPIGTDTKVEVMETKKRQIEELQR